MEDSVRYLCKKFAAIKARSWAQGCSEEEAKEYVEGYVEGYTEGYNEGSAEEDKFIHDFLAAVGLSQKAFDKYKKEEILKGWIEGKYIKNLIS